VSEAGEAGVVPGAKRRTAALLQASRVLVDASLPAAEMEAIRSGIESFASQVTVVPADPGTVR